MSEDHDGTEPLATVVRWRDLHWRPDVSIPTVWEELFSFTEWLLRRYVIAPEEVPHCWFKHGAFVEEFSALHAAYTAAYDDADSGYGPIGFQERLQHARARFPVHYVRGTCNSGHQTRTRRGEPSAEDFALWATETHTHD